MLQIELDLSLVFLASRKIGEKLVLRDSVSHCLSNLRNIAKLNATICLVCYQSKKMKIINKHSVYIQIM